MYVSLSVPPSLTVMKDALTKAGPAYSDISTLLEMTKQVYLAVTFAPDQTPQISAAAVGGYPSMILDIRLGSGKDWKPTSSPAGSWFKYARGGIRLCAASDTVVLLSNGGMKDLLPRLKDSQAVAIPPDVASDMDHADLVLYLPRLPGGLSGTSASGAHIPIQEVWMDAHKIADGYEVGGTVNLTSEKEAKLLAIVGRLALVAWLRSLNIADVADKLNSVSIEPQGNQVILSGLDFTEEEVAPVFLSLITGAMPQQEEQTGAPQ